MFPLPNLSSLYFRFCLEEAPNHLCAHQQSGYFLHTERNGLIALLEEWQATAVNHAALGIQFSQRPAAEVIQEIAEDTLPPFSSLQGPPPIALDW